MYIYIHLVKNTGTHSTNTLAFLETNRIDAMHPSKSLIKTHIAIEINSATFKGPEGALAATLQSNPSLIAVENMLSYIQYIHTSY